MDGARTVPGAPISYHLFRSYRMTLESRTRSKRIIMARALSESRSLPVDSVDARRLIRAGKHTGHTAAMAPDFVQGNLCILPSAYAADFADFCHRNPKPCPLIGMSAVGVRDCHHWARTWTFARICPAIGSIAMAGWWTSRRISAPIGVMIW